MNICFIYLILINYVFFSKSVQLVFLNFLNIFWLHVSLSFRSHVFVAKHATTPHRAIELTTNSQ